MISSKHAKTLCCALLLGAAAPVLAQADDMAMAPKSNMSCQDMMDHSKPMMDKMADGDMKMKAQKEMDSAKMSMDKSDEKTCKMHMHKAMGMMKDAPMK